jgi:hypothetical protein
MSDIQAIIELIENGHRNSDHGDGRRQINEAVAILRKMQEDSHLHSGQRWELSQILECGPLYRDIEKAVREMKEAQRECWLTIDSAPKDGTEVFLCSSEESFPSECLCGDGYAEGFYEGLDEDGDGDIWLVYDRRPDGDFFIVKPTHWMRKVAKPPFIADHLTEPE